MENDNMNFEWFENLKIYQVFIDRFSGHKDVYTEDELRKGFLYGNIKSLINKLDYIKSLNFNMIWITPFYVNQINGYHGYHVVNFNHVDPRFAYGENIEDKNIGNVFDLNDVNIETGSDLVLKDLINECHKRNIKIMMDFIPNHVHKTHPYFENAFLNENSTYKNWFYIKTINTGNKKKKKKQSGIKTYLKFLDIDELPKLNLENEDCFQHLLNSTKKFLKYGIDAIRVDHCIGPSKNALQKFVAEIHKEFPKVPFIGECLPFNLYKHRETILGLTEEQLLKLDTKISVDSINDLDEVFLSYNNILDGLLDFSFQAIIDLFVSKQIDDKACVKIIEKHYSKFNNIKLFLVKNIDSHDSDRIFFKCNNNVLLFKKAMELLYRKYNNRNDPLIVYYGTEDFMTQTKTIYGEPYGDFRCRQPMYFGLNWIKSFFKEKNE